MAIGLASAGDPEDAQAYSGIPASLLAALREVGVRVHPLPTDPGPWAGRALVGGLGLLRARRLGDLRRPRALLARERMDVTFGAAFTRLRNRRVRRSLRRLDLDGVIQYGSESTLPPHLRYVIYEDSTVLQARESYPWAHMEISDRTFAQAMARERTCYETARACCAMSHWAARSIVGDYGQPEGKVKVVGLGVTQRPRPIRNRGWTIPRFLFVGFDWVRKNGDLVVMAFAAVREQFPDAELHLVGGHPPIAVPGVFGHGRLGLDSSADRARLAMLFERATCLVLPSLHEPAGIVYAEAGASGIASIGTTNGGAETIIGDGGRLVDPGSGSGLVDAMLELARPEVAASLGARALERSKLFTWRKVAERLLRALEPPGLERDGLAEFL